MCHSLLISHMISQFVTMCSNVPFNHIKVIGGDKFLVRHMLMLYLHIFHGWSIMNSVCHRELSRSLNKYRPLSFEVKVP